ncbi:DNA-3-methyladenine glycosylase family protein [Actinophytocola oryzae]|uniref:3-methyladenine DNA glycosylase/8-oxoguanine DNA glycosylase n=1 Tax=Actinophytocola oryzae TaxID=502181 RepID=A0A4R7USW1_9PSEU|nr:DNA-3-methyladenine glycosylase 2 family protein [Actinophytocola oryzae]TDV36832.1 3-methyladenine DNA glycosylase/8-oxoguanine DNA glycosylase [Actinophytocola oryzae]
MRASIERGWRPDFALDLRSVLAPLRRGLGDPAFRVTDAGRIWLVANTGAGVGTLALHTVAGEVRATAWGDAAQLLTDGLPALLGAEDDDSGFEAHHPLIADLRRRMPALRLGSTGRVWDPLVASVLEQKVTGHEAHRSWRELCRRFGTRAPGPAPEGMYAPPTPAAVLAIKDWEWHRAGVDLTRRKAIVAAAQVAHRLEKATRLRGREGRDLLRTVPGIGFWTAAEIAQRAWGDPDAVSVGDFHIPGLVGYALLGRKVDDKGMLEVLAPYAPQRHRVVRYIEAGGPGKPRFGPRFAPRDYRGM